MTKVVNIVRQIVSNALHTGWWAGGFRDWVAPGNDSSRLKDQGLKAKSTSAAGYVSAEYHEKFAESLAATGANENQIRTRPETGKVTIQPLPVPTRIFEGEGLISYAARDAARNGTTVQAIEKALHEARTIPKPSHRRTPGTAAVMARPRCPPRERLHHTRPDRLSRCHRPRTLPALHLRRREEKA